MPDRSADQLLRERAQEIRAKETSRAQHQRLRSRAQESRTPYGGAMVRQHGEPVRDALELLLAKWAAKPGLSGPHYCALPLLLHLAGRGGPAVIVSVALPLVIDGISQTRSHRRLALAIGTALEQEVRGATLKEKRSGTLRLMKRRYTTREITDPRLLKTMRIEPGKWSVQDRFEVGALLLDLVAGTTGLVQLAGRQRKGRPVVDVKPSASALAIIKATPMRQLPTKRLPMLEQPRPWTDLHGGGHMGNTKPLVVRAPHLEAAAIPLQLAAVNQLQAQQMAVNPSMVAIQQEAWDCGVDVFPVKREPLEAPPRPTEKVGKEGMREWYAAAMEARIDRQQNAPLRLKVQRSIAALKELEGEPCWFAYELDWRGRIYSSNREATHQGPDWEKAAIELQGEPAGEEGFEWMLKAAAGHWGERGTWADRLSWGKENLDLLTAAAEHPLDRVDLWRDAKDPWQFLQLCGAVRQWLVDPRVPIGCPVRLDQHASGMAILAALTRDGKLGAMTRLTGDTPADLYGLMAERVVARLRLDLEAGPPHHQRQAAQWLDLGVTRSTLKGPTMTTIYGAGFWSVADGLAAQLEAVTDISPARYERELVQPSQYLARHINAVLKEELASCLKVQAWLREVGRLVVQTQEPVRWTTPTGFPVELGAEQQQRAAVRTAVSGNRRWAATRATPGELSARVTSRGITANLTHSFDASYCMRVICRAGELGFQVLTNHDCFAAIPAHAGQLHRLLHEELAALYQPNWLGRVHREIQSGSGVELPKPPMVGRLTVGEIGTNPYAFS
jgi:DNA-directed RNA polymerase, mitochondrial